MVHFRSRGIGLEQCIQLMKNSRNGTIWFHGEREKNTKLFFYHYLTVHFYGAMLYFVGFYVLLLFDIVISIQVENLTAITSSQGTINGYVQSAFLTCGYLLAASVVALRCLNLVPDLAAWMIPEGDTAFSTRNFGEGVASSVKGSAMSVMGKVL